MDMKPKKETRAQKPIAILTINVDVSKQTPWKLNRITTWIETAAETLQKDAKNFGKCRFRLMK